MVAVVVVVMLPDESKEIEIEIEEVEFEEVLKWISPHFSHVLSSMYVLSIVDLFIGIERRKKIRVV